MPGVNEYGQAITISSTTQYNWEGKVDYTEDPNQNKTIFEYDRRGFLTKITDAENGETAFWYDRAGRKTAEVSPKYFDASKALDQMNRKKYAYDSMGRVLSEIEIYFDEREGQWISFVSKAYKYDANGNIIKELDALGYEAGTGTTYQQRIDTGYGMEYVYNLNNQITIKLDPVNKQKGLQYTVKYT